MKYPYEIHALHKQDTDHDGMREVGRGDRQLQRIAIECARYLQLEQHYDSI
jgi:hypothetical protein